MIDVRLGNDGDAALLAELGRRTFRHAFSENNDPVQMEAYLASAFSPALQLAELKEPGSEFLIAEQDDAPVGYARLRSRSQPPPEVRARSPIELVRFYLEPSSMGRGIGSHLMEAVVKRSTLHGHDAIWLSVWERNARAIRFYERHGFVAAGRLQFVLGEEVQDDVLMVLRIRA